MPRPHDILPSRYYHDHFHEMVRFVIGLYGDTFDRREAEFLEEFPKLSVDAQCLFIRMTNRKRPVFRIDDLLYSEVENVADALDELQHYGWIRTAIEKDYPLVLSTVKKDRLVNLLKSDCCSGIRASWKRDKVIGRVLERISFQTFMNLNATGRLYVPQHQDVVQFLLYLYFGKTNDGLTSFALRDLGIVTAKEKPSYSARFADMAEAKAGYFYSAAIKDMRTFKQSAIERYAEMIDTFPPVDTEYVRSLRNSTLHLMGQHFEREKDPERAKDIYRLSDDYASRERLVRLLFATGCKEEAETALLRMIDDPSCDDEHNFAADFYTRKFGRRRISAHTALLRTGKSISVDEYYRGSPEEAVLRHFRKDGWHGCHGENTLWNAVFGLLFWEELFEQPGALGSGFDDIPHLLRKKAFYSSNKDAIETKLAALGTKGAVGIIRRTCQTHFGGSNGIFPWFDGIEDMAAGLAEHAPPNALAQILRKLAQDYFDMSDSFPDLYLVRGNAVKFVEVKAEGDQIRRRQLTRIQQLQSAGFTVEIMRVRYHVDPDQIYVVLDVETTGGRPPGDRITEIGAMKIQNGNIIGEWSSLINPGRHIPSFITSLTGITNEMVSDAPTFSDIADELLEFMEGAVFAAHNVNFDYGFIASEFRRLEKPFRMPKVCTCSSMRKLFPGHASYSLANICREYGISLNEHHRALCDAKAAAGLLLIINEARISLKNAA